MPDAAAEWVGKNAQSFPAELRPDPSDLRALGLFFGTYLQTSFDLIPDPGRRLYSVDAHCFCPLCSWLVNAPHLRTKRVTKQAKRVATRLEYDWVESLATEAGHPRPAEVAVQLVDDELPRGVSALGAYGVELLERLEGRSQGPAVLALWRRFAWTREGSPKKGFRLTAEKILDTEQEVVRRLERSAALAALGYSQEWLDAGVVDDELIAAQWEAILTSDDPHPEHYRHRAFVDWLERQSHLSDAQLTGVMALRDWGPDGTDLHPSRVIELLRGDLLTDAQLEQLGAYPEVHAPPIAKRYRRAVLRRRLDAEGPSADVCAAMREAGDPVLDEALLAHPDRTRAHLEWLASNGTTRRIRNLASSQLQSRRWRT